MKINGEITIMLEALGKPIDDERTQTALALVGETVKDEHKEGRTTYLILSAFDDGTIFSLKNGKVDKVVMRLQEETRYGLYPRPDALIDGLDGEVNRTDVLTILGQPISSRPDWDMFAAGRHRVHVRYRDNRIARISALTH